MFVASSIHVAPDAPSPGADGHAMHFELHGVSETAQKGSPGKHIAIPSISKTFRNGCRVATPELNCLQEMDTSARNAPPGSQPEPPAPQSTSGTSVDKPMQPEASSSGSAGHPRIPRGFGPRRPGRCAPPGGPQRACRSIPPATPVERAPSWAERLAGLICGSPSWDTCMWPIYPS